MTPERLKELEKRSNCICPKWCLDTPPEDMGGHNWDDCHRYCPRHGEGFFQKNEEAELVTALHQAGTWAVDCQWGCDAGAHASGCPLKYPGNYESKEALDKALEIIIVNLHRAREKARG